MSTTPKPPTTMTPELTRGLAVAMPLVQAFAAEISKLPPEVQQRSIAMVLAAMRDEAAVN